MPWLRLWTDILDDVDIHSLTLDQVGAWTLLLAAAKKHNRGGELPPIKTLAFWVHHPMATVQDWINGLVTAGFIDGNGVTYTMHGWEKWQEPQDKTNAARQSRFKAKHKAPPVPPGESNTDTDTEQTVTATPLPKSVTPLPAGVSDGLEPFDPGPATSGAKPPEGWTAEHQRVLDRNTDRFGSSNGDRLVSDLLKDFNPKVVAAACDIHYADTNGAIDGKRLRGICQAMHDGRWKLPGAGKAPAPAKPDNRRIFTASPEQRARYEADQATLKIPMRPAS